MPLTTDVILPKGYGPLADPSLINLGSPTDTLVGAPPNYYGGDPYIAALASTGSNAGTDATSCHDNCDANYSTDPQAWAACVAQCGYITAPDCSQFGAGACIPNWIPLPGSVATQPVPPLVKFGLPAGLTLIALAILAALILRVQVNV